MNQESNRCIGIIADGGTDREILKTLVRCALLNDDEIEKNTKIVLLQRQIIRDHIEEFLFIASRDNNYTLSGSHSQRLIDRIVATLYGAFTELGTFSNRPLNNKDLIILNSDAERTLKSAECYFEDWASMLTKLIIFGIEKYYHHKAKQGYNLENEPFIIPLILFPSTDILVLAAKSAFSHRFNGFDQNAPRLKRIIYGTDDLRRLNSDDFTAKALNFITNQSISSIYKYLPETRLFLHTLTWI
jgi:hypothetical protein